MQIFRKALIGLCLLGVIALHAQDVSISNLRSLSDGQISFDYTVEQSHSPRERYDVQIFTSADNYARALSIQQKTIPPGIKQNVTFSAADHLPSDFAGSLRIRVLAEAVVYPVQITDYSSKTKSGSSISITWKDEGRSGSYDVVLDQNGQTTTIARGVTGTSYSGELPVDISKGKYELKVIPSSNASNVSDEMPFIVSGKMGLGVKVLGALAAGGVAILASSGGGGEGGPGSLPAPPDTPDN